MESAHIHSCSRQKARIEIIPLIDVIFFLLATFVLFTLSLNRIQSVPIDLPRSGPPTPYSDLVTIQVSDQGSLYWNRELFDLDELVGRLEQFKKNSGAPRILVAGDNQAKWNTTVRVLDQIRKVGIENVSMETRTRPTGR